MKTEYSVFKICIVLGCLAFNGCQQATSPNRQMARLLAAVAQYEYNYKNNFCPDAKLAFYDSSLAKAQGEAQTKNALYFKANVMLELGEEQNAITLLEGLIKGLQAGDRSRFRILMRDLGIAYLRLGERQNCIHNHAGESCIFPIQGAGVHTMQTGSRKAIEIYEALLQDNPEDYESRWLLNIAYMTLGEYPQKVPAPYVLKGLDQDTSHLVKPFIDVAVNIGLNTKNMAGGSIVDDFNNDGYLDIVTSAWDLKDGMHYCRNNGNGSFTDVSDSSGLHELTGGLNIQQTDFNNDGLKDIFVLRGAWKGTFGKEPVSLLRNNGDGTFTDVTKKSGLLAFMPTQTATWNDFNNDGWLDVFIGHENSPTAGADYNPCQLYINNKNGTFTEIAAEAGCQMIAFVKGVTSGDFDNDGKPDIFLSTLYGRKYLLKNDGVKNGKVHFTNVSESAGLYAVDGGTFTTWFWDYDNDGWLDIMCCDYEARNSLAYYAAKEALHLPAGDSGKIFLFHNNQDGTFKEVSKETGVHKVVYSMGANFGDIDNDGYLDMYLGTGNPQYQSLVPNKMFKNIDGKSFVDVTTSARVGSLQKGHGVAFADLDNDGDEDIYIDMGGAFIGDVYQNSLYVNPGQNKNHWISLNLEGVKSNRVAIGARIKVTFKENGRERSVFRDVNSGGSFGSNPLMQHIGIGSATMIDRIEIRWPVSQQVQVFEHISPDQVVKIKEGVNSMTRVNLKSYDFTTISPGLISCTPTP